MVRLAAASVLLLLAACGAPRSDAAQDVQSLAVPSTSSTAGGHTSGAGQDERRALGNGLMITVSAPKSFTPTETAYPRSPRAVAFELAIDNESAESFQPSQLSVTATCNGDRAMRVIDSTQGYPGSVGTTDEIPPGRQLRLAVAFAVPTEQAEVTLTVQPDAQDSGRVTVYEGTV